MAVPSDLFFTEIVIYNPPWCSSNLCREGFTETSRSTEELEGLTLTQKLKLAGESSIDMAPYVAHWDFAMLFLDK